jgi:hypothetical protein
MSEQENGPGRAARMGFIAAVLSACGVATPGFAADAPHLKVYVAKKIITMEPAIPEATAVAVADGRIVSVGSLESLQPWMERRDTVIDRTFEDKVLMPGFIDPHVHPSLPAVLTQFPFLAPDDWSLPTGNFPGAATPEAYVTALESLVDEYFSAADRDPKIPFIVWGYHQLWHGKLRRPQLDVLFPDKPVILWHRSFHELIMNTAALRMIGISREETDGNHEIDWDAGHFWEIGAKVVLEKPTMRFLFDPARYGKGMGNFLSMLRQAGVTSALDMGTGVFGDPDAEIALVKHAMERSQAPARVVLTPIITDFLVRGVSPEEALSQVERWTRESTDRVLFDGHFKLMMDGAAFSGLGQMGFPGYIDGHEGVWMAHEWRCERRGVDRSRGAAPGAEAPVRSSRSPRALHVCEGRPATAPARPGSLRLGEPILPVHPLRHVCRAVARPGPGKEPRTVGGRHANRNALRAPLRRSDGAPQPADAGVGCGEPGDDQRQSEPGDPGRLGRPGTSSHHE